jgi:riboflavin synthase
VSQNSFAVAIIPYTFEHTNMQQIKKGDKVNIEFDMVGKYVVRGMELGNRLK